MRKLASETWNLYSIIKEAEDFHLGKKMQMARVPFESLERENKMKIPQIQPHITIENKNKNTFKYSLTKVVTSSINSSLAEIVANI